jgi:hypothetical protein
MLNCLCLIWTITRVPTRDDSKGFNTGFTGLNTAGEQDDGDDLTEAIVTAPDHSGYGSAGGGYVGDLWANWVDTFV